MNRQELNKIYLGKILTVKINDRDFEGNVILDKFTTVKGRCEFIGYNKILDCFQVTIDRMPITDIDLKNIINVE